MKAELDAYAKGFPGCRKPRPIDGCSYFHWVLVNGSSTLGAFLFRIERRDPLILLTDDLND